MFEKKGNGSCKVCANIRVSGNDILLEETVWVGTPKILPDFMQRQTRLNDFFTLCHLYQYSTENQRTITEESGTGQNYEWQAISNNFDYYAHGKNANFLTYVNNTMIAIKVRCQNSCGLSNWQPLMFKVKSCNQNEDYYMKLFPNPASSTITIDLDNKEIEQTSRSKQQEYEIQIWNSHSLTKSIKTKSLQTEIPISGLTTGYYYVVVNINGKKYKKKFFKQ